MARRIIWLTLVLLSLTVVCQAAVPAFDVCKGALEPSKEGHCGDVEWVGCCDVLGRALWCDGGSLYCLDCAESWPACGWNPLGYYDCGFPADSVDPSGAAPPSCSACGESCQEAACSPACPGSCGKCSESGG